MRLDAIVIQSYDPGWPASFKSQAARLTAVIEHRLVTPLEHIGSTAIPGMLAKPIVDMLAVVDAHETFAPALRDVEQIGWRHAPEPGDEDRRKWSLCFPTVEQRTHHLHVVEHDSTGWRDWLLFRDYLRTHPSDAERYATLKRELAAIDGTDRVRYRSGKAPLIRELLDQAHEWADHTRT